MTATTTTDKLKAPTVSLAAYLSLLFTVTFFIILNWGELIADTLIMSFTAPLLGILVFAFLAQLTGVKKVGADEVWKIVDETWKKAKERHAGNPEQILNYFEVGMMFFSKAWDRTKEAINDVFRNTDGVRDGKITPPPEPEIPPVVELVKPVQPPS